MLVIVLVRSAVCLYVTRRLNPWFAGQYARRWTKLRSWTRQFKWRWQFARSLATPAT